MKTTKTPDLSWIQQYQTSQPHFGLSRIRHLLSLRGNPHLQLSVIHIAGTNGKGSTIAHLRQLLLSRGLKVGTFTSPYLVQYNEQISINHSAISNKDLKKFLSTYQHLFQQHSTDEQLFDITEFEILTALAYDYFAQQKVDVAIIEVGMGGRLDSTNVCQPDITAITTIGLEHTNFLGNSLASIAEQKAGIIKENVELIVGNIPEEARAAIEEIANRKKAPYFCYDKDYHVRYVSSLDDGECFYFTNANRQEEVYKTPLIGLHQIDNAGLAIEICDSYCQQKKIKLLSQEEIVEAMKRVAWLGRMEKVSDKPIVLLDGAHNPHALKIVLKSLEKHYPTFHKNFLFSCIQTKSLNKMVDMLKQVPDSQLVLTSFSDSRSFSPETMKLLAKKEQVRYDDWQSFLKTYLETERTEQEILLITGSLYFLAQVRQYLVN